jgi:signal peptidase complex subunit 2
VKLALGYTAVIIAAITFALDYKYGFEATKQFTTLAVVAYFLLNGAFTYWIWGVEKGLIYVGAWKGRKVSPLPYCSILLFQQLTCTKQITITSRADKFDPTYKLNVTYHPSSLNTIPPVDKEISAPFMQWFTADGFFVAAPFQQWLATNIDMVGDADPKNVADGTAGLVSAQSVQPEGLQDLLNVIKSGPPAAAPRKRG